jgi:hypothetical protein
MAVARAAPTVGGTHLMRIGKEWLTGGVAQLAGICDTSGVTVATTVQSIVLHLIIVANQWQMNLLSLNSNSNTLLFYFQTKSNGACIETANFAIQLRQSKFTFWKVKASKKFRKFTKFFQTCLKLKQIHCKFTSSFASRNCNSFYFVILTFFQKVNFGARELQF